jgi:hypothetical protein
MTQEALRSGSEKVVRRCTPGYLLLRACGASHFC